MRVKELVEVLSRLDPDATIGVFLDDEDADRAPGIFEPLVIEDDSDGWVAVNIGGMAIMERRS